MKVVELLFYIIKQKKAFKKFLDVNKIPNNIC